MAAASVEENSAAVMIWRRMNHIALLEVGGGRERGGRVEGGRERERENERDGRGREENQKNFKIIIIHNYFAIFSANTMCWRNNNYCNYTLRRNGYTTIRPTQSYNIAS